MRDEIETDTPQENKQVSVSEEDTTYAKSSMGMKLGCKDQKVSGCEWDYEEDVIALELTVNAERAKGLPITKRTTLKLLAGVFDPLGLISPITLSAKVMFQESCRLKIGWDDQLDGDIRKGVEAWIKGFVDCQRIVIKRCVYDHIHQEVVECWLHGFADASKRAYCGVVYFVYGTSVGWYVRMLTSKSCTLEGAVDSKARAHGGTRHGEACSQCRGCSCCSSQGETFETLVGQQDRFILDKEQRRMEAIRETPCE